MEPSHPLRKTEALADLGRIGLCSFLLTLLLLSGPSSRAQQPPPSLNSRFVDLLNEYLLAPETESLSSQQGFRRQLLIDHILSPRQTQQSYILWIELIDKELLKSSEAGGRTLYGFELLLSLQARWEALYLQTYSVCQGQNLALHRGSQGATAGTALTLASFLIPQIDRRVPLYFKLFRHSFPLFGAYGGWELGEVERENLEKTHSQCLPSSIPPAPAHLSKLNLGLDLHSQDWLDEVSYQQLIYGAMSLSVGFSTYELIRKLQLSLKGIGLLSRSALLAGIVVSAGAFAAEKGVEKGVESHNRRKLEAELIQAIYQDELDLSHSAQALGHFYSLDFYRELSAWENRRQTLEQEICQVLQEDPHPSGLPIALLENRIRRFEGQRNHALTNSLSRSPLSGCQWTYEAHQVLQELVAQELSLDNSRQTFLGWPRHRQEVLNHLRSKRDGSMDEAQWAQQKMHQLQTELSDKLSRGQICSHSGPAFLFQIESYILNELRQISQVDKALRSSRLEINLLEIRGLRRALENLIKEAFSEIQEAPFNCSAN